MPNNIQHYRKVLDFVRGQQGRVDREAEREEKQRPVVISDDGLKISNAYCSFEYNPVEKTIDGDDKTDENNMPACYNKTRRGIKHAWDVLVEKFDRETTMYQALDILSDEKLRMRSFCRMD